MFDLKRISRDGVQAALQKSERYRLLNEPWEAESICLDILELEPTNQSALVSLLLSITDQFRTGGAHRAGEAKALIPKLESEYEQAYYTGIIWERKGTALHRLRSPGWGPVAYERLREAMLWYEKAIELRPPGDDSSIVRWNSCARFIMSHEAVKSPPVGPTHTLLE
jgi:tetratricopeptide (TPR) repeat protein